ncbi:MAG: membrane protein insertion efficiency factor YidD [Desulfatirhabdiaceae bacterium]
MAEWLDDGMRREGAGRLSPYIPLCIDLQKNIFAALSVGDGRKRPIPSLLPCEMSFLKIYSFRLIFNTGCILAMCLLGCAHSNQPETKTDTGVIAWYQTYVSPIDGDRCPMTPSCSSYARQSVQKHGVFWGWIMTCDRLIRCGRDETRLSPHVAENNRIRIWDPVWMNDFWWVNEGAE